MFMRLSLAFALCVSVFGYPHATSAEQASTKPESVISEFYELMSFEAGQLPEFKRVRELMTDIKQTPELKTEAIQK